MQKQGFYIAIFERVDYNQSSKDWPLRFRSPQMQRFSIGTLVEGVDLIYGETLWVIDTQVDKLFLCLIHNVHLPDRSTHRSMIGGHTFITCLFHEASHMVLQGNTDCLV